MDNRQKLIKKHPRLAYVCVLVAVMTACGRSPEIESPATDAAGPAAKPSHAKYALQWVSNDISQTMSAGKAAPVHISVKNTGDWAWPDAQTANPSQPDGRYAVRLTYRWVTANNVALPENPARGEITAPVPPGGTAVFSLEINPPKESGSYQLQLDLVQELVTFFSAKGVEKLVVPVTVQ